MCLHNFLPKQIMILKICNNNFLKYYYYFFVFLLIFYNVHKFYNIIFYINIRLLPTHTIRIHLMQNNHNCERTRSSPMTTGIRLARSREAYFRHLVSGHRLDERPVGNHRAPFPRRDQCLPVRLIVLVRSRLDGFDPGLEQARDRERGRPQRVQKRA